MTRFNPENDYVTAAVYKNGEIVELGKVKHGLDEETWRTLKDVFRTKGRQVAEGYELPPAVCASIHTLDLLSGELREPHFRRLTPEKSASSCTWHQAQLDLAMFPEAVDVTHTAKAFWPRADLAKGDLLVYMRNIAPYMLPFLRERLLTIIRCPDGVQGESFFQKSRPDDAPDFLKGITHDGDKRFVCNTTDALIWLANQGALEYHIPFQTADQVKPREIVFDLDPPGREQFTLAIQAARLLKQVLDDLQLVSFLKTSGGKGLQVHIPLPSDSLTYEETGVLTQAVAWTLENSYPDLFTTERLKAKRGGRLYIDYLQHAEGKTIVAPYSPRKREDATVAAPLFWEELTDDLRPDEFQIDNAVERVQTIGCPFAGYFAAGDAQVLANVLSLIRK
ncbi:hypothetical protein GCM10028778_23600 [Barrientosiimonas marina]|uniref:DNA ligase D n=1 Tax=Lentibacillus kimchii TaxID=1542911 RepID=A0ABW2V0S0_9BACI